MIKTKETIIEEMCDYLKGISVGLKELIQENYNIKQMNPLFHLREVFWLEKKCKGNTGILKLYYELNLCKINNFTLNDIHKIITKFFIAEGKLELFSKFNIKKLYKLFLMDFPEKLRDLIIEKEYQSMNFNLDMIEFTEKITRFLVFLRIIDEIKNIDAFYNSFVENQLVFKFLKLIPKINRILKKLKTFQQLIEEIIEIEDPFYMNFKNGVNWKDFFNKNSNIFEAETLSKEKLILLISDYFFKIKK